MKLFERKKYDFQLKVTIFASIVRLCQLDSLDFFDSCENIVRICRQSDRVMGGPSYKPPKLPAHHSI